MAKKTRLWPNMKAMMTVGRAMTAAAAIRVAARSCPPDLRMKARGSSLFEKACQGEAPRAAAATAM